MRKRAPLAFSLAVLSTASLATVASAAEVIDGVTRRTEPVVIKENTRPAPVDRGEPGIKHRPHEKPADPKDINPVKPLGGK